MSESDPKRPPFSARRIMSSRPSFFAQAFEPGAVYELSLRVPWADAEEYLSLYAEWFFDVDTAEESGRKLLTVLSREFGDDHNLVFLYWYESPYKEHYYSKYAKAFFNYHLRAGSTTRTELMSLYGAAARVLGETAKDANAILAELNGCKSNDEVPAAVGETIRKVDEKLRKLVVSDDSSWSFGVNPRKVQRFGDAVRRGAVVDLGNCPMSFLERCLPAATAVGANHGSTT